MSEVAAGRGVKYEPLRFRLVHILYLVALWSSALATFGPGGLCPCVLFSVFWGAIFTSRNRPRALAIALLLCLCVPCLVSLLLPAVSSARSAARRMQCSNNLKQIALALHNYHETYAAFPPAYIPDEAGRPMHSWRVLILPFVEEQGLYDAYDFGEPWDGPNNSRLAREVPYVYRCPSADDAGQRGTSYTSYLAVVGPKTAWPGTIGRQISEVTDGSSQTLLVLESTNHDIRWMEPRDLQYDEAIALLSREDPFVAVHRASDFFYDYPGGRNIALVDGSVRFFSNGIGRNRWNAMLGIDDGVSWDADDLYGEPKLARRPKLGNWFRLGLFLVIVFFPLPWVWINPTSGINVSPEVESRARRNVL